MKKLNIIVVIMLALGLVTFANASLTFYEPFNYTFGALTDVSAGFGDWTTHSGTLGQWSTMNVAGDSGNSLTYPGLAASAGSRIYGDKAFTEDVHKSFDNVVPPGDLFCSMLVKCIEAPTSTSGDYFAHFNEGPSFTSNFRVRVFARPTTGGVSYGLGWGSASVDPSTYTGIFSLNTTHLVVFKISMISGSTTSQDTGYLWVDPSSGSFGGSEPTPYAVVTATGNQGIAASPGLNDLSLRMGSANSHGSFEIDEIRIGTSWADITPPGGPSISPSGTINLNPGNSRQFTASGGSGTYTWSLSTDIFGSLDTTGGSQVTFTATSVGSVILTVSDGSQQASVTIDIVPTSAPLMIDTEGVIRDYKKIVL